MNHEPTSGVGEVPWAVPPLLGLGLSLAACVTTAPPGREAPALDLTESSLEVSLTSAASSELQR